MLLTGLWIVAIAWLLILVVALPHLGRRVTLDPLPPERNPQTRRWPLVSILVAARNEERRALREAISSMLAQDYPHFEVIAVDDRSTDGTLRVLRELAAAHPRLRVIEGAELPPGWLGKPHALQQAVDMARGEWLLGTDADVLFDPAAVRTAVALAQEQGYDVLVLWPKVDCLSFWERVILPLDQAVSSALCPLRRVNNPQTAEAFTYGQFTLMKRSALVDIGGYEAVKKEVVEDIAMGYRFKQQGHRLHVIHAPHLLHARSYSNLREIWEAHIRYLFASLAYAPVLRQTRYSSLSELLERQCKHPMVSIGITGGCALLAGVIGVLLAVMPPIVLLVSLLLMIEGGLSSDVVRLTVPALVSTTIVVGLHAKFNERLGVAWPYALLAPLGYAVFMAMLLASTRSVLTGRGVRWKGRHIYETSNVKSAK